MQKLLFAYTTWVLLLASQASATAAPVNANLQMLFDETSVTCEGACPEAVGYLLTWGPWDEKQIHTAGCTGFMATPDIVGTDSHCIPPEVVAHPELCSERIGIKFPAVGNHPTESLTCTQLIQASYIENRSWGDDEMPAGLKSPDYAFFRVQRTGRVPLTVSRRGVKNHTPLTFYVARKLPPDPKAKTPHRDVVIKAVSCPTYQRSVYTEYLHDFSTFVMSEGDACQVAHGDSGAPAVDETGTVPAVLVDREYVKEGLEKYATKNDVVLQTEKTWPVPAYSLNYACMDIPAEVNPNLKPSECLRIEELNAKGMAERKARSNKFQDEDEALDLSAFNKQIPMIFWAKAHADRNGPRALNYSFDVKCLIPKESWSSKIPVAPVINNNMVSVKFYEQTTVYKDSINAKMFLHTIKVKNEIRQNQITVDLGLVGAMDSVVGTRSVNGVKLPFSTHWCSSTDYAQK